MAAEYCSKPAIINVFQASFKRIMLSAPNSPWSMGYSIFHAAAFWLRGVAPVMFGDEFLLRPGTRQCRLIGHARAHSIPCTSYSPGIFCAEKSGSAIDAVRHWQGDIVLVIQSASDGGDCPAGYNLTDEHNAAFDFVSFFSSHVETQIDFFEIAVEGNGKPKDSCIQEAEADQT